MWRSLFVRKKTYPVIQVKQNKDLASIHTQANLVRKFSIVVFAAAFVIVLVVVVVDSMQSVNDMSHGCHIVTIHG